MKRTATATAAATLSLLLASCGGVIAESGTPPMRYRADAIVTVAYVTDVEKACTDAGLKNMEGMKPNACTVISRDGPRIILAHPCSAAGWNPVACHEVGHVNGWSGAHED